MNLDKYETAGGEALEVLAAPDTRFSAPYAAEGVGVALVDRWIFSRLARATAQVNDALEHFRFHEAAHVVYHFFWGDFCDWYIEWVKPELLSVTRAKSAATWKNLFAAFESALRLLHPFMPFLTEELWQQLPQRQGARSIALDRFPEPHAERIDASSEEQVALLQEIITAVRNIRAEMKVDQKAKLAAQLAPATPEVKSTVEGSLETILRLAGLSSLSFAALPFDSTKGVVRSSKYFEFFIGYEAAFDVSAEIARLRKESKQLETNIASNQKRLEDQTFRSRAPGHIVKGLETTLAERRSEFEKLTQRLAQLEKNLGATGQPET
jgi:valyl-tRNA synthetase